MANKTIRVRLKKVNDPLHPENDDILHPETEWSLVKDRPSINESAGDMHVTPKRRLQIEVGDDIYVKTLDTGGEMVQLSWYPVFWEAIRQKPTGTYLTSAEHFPVVKSYPKGYVAPGIYFYQTQTGVNVIALVMGNSNGVWGFYFNGNGTVVPFETTDLLDSNKRFTALAVYQYTFNHESF